MHDDILRIHEILTTLQEALSDFSNGNRDRLFDSRIQLRDLADRVSETAWRHVTPVCEGVQKLLGNVLRYGDLREEDSIELATELIKFVEATFESPAPVIDGPRLMEKAPEVDPMIQAQSKGVINAEASISVSANQVEESLLGEILIKMDKVDRHQLNRALGLQQVCRKRLGEVLISIGAIDDETLEEALEYQRAITIEMANGLNNEGGGLELRLVDPGILDESVETS